MRVTPWYFSGVFKKLTISQKNALMREHWLRTKELGRARFIRRMMVESFVFWLIICPAADLLGDHSRSTLQTIVLANLVMLPIFVLGGYLNGRWKWTDLEKKYPTDSVPPRE